MTGTRAVPRSLATAGRGRGRGVSRAQVEPVCSVFSLTLTRRPCFGDHSFRRREGPVPGRRRQPADPLGRARHAGAPGDPRAVRGREAAGGPADVGLPARHRRDGQPGPHAQGRRRRPGADRLQPALDPGRRRRQPGAGLRHRRLRHQAARTSDTYYKHIAAALRAPAARHDGRRRRPGQRHDLHRPGPARRRPRRGPAPGRQKLSRRPSAGRWSTTSSAAWRRRRPASSACGRWRRTAC